MDSQLRLAICAALPKENPRNRHMADPRVKIFDLSGGNIDRVEIACLFPRTMILVKSIRLSWYLHKKHAPERQNPGQMPSI